MMMVLMWVGASPASTGGGIKTTTFALALLSVRAAAFGRSPAEVFRRRIPGTAMVRALSTVILSLLIAVAIVFVLLLTERHQLYQLMFEVLSALGTVGLSTGITPSLTTAGKLVIVLTIFIGRIGVLGAVLAFTPKREGRPGVYTEDNVLTM
jgi:Trk-type K+ transport system membrane component